MTSARFALHVGARFAAAPEPGGAPVATLTLVRVEAPPDGGNADGNGRPFSLEFEIAEGARAEQGLYRLTPLDAPASGEPNDSVGVSDPGDLVFLVPIGPRLLEAVFN